jgi:ATP-dependent protease ClpP protease subunit
MKLSDIKAMGKLPDTAEIMIYGVIGYEVTIGAVKQALALAPQTTKRIALRINSPGGVVDEGFKIMDAVRAMNLPVDTYVDYEAASMASVIFTMGERRYLDANAKVMIHNPRASMFGTADQVRKNADWLEGQENLLINAYEPVMKRTREQISAMMDEETWMNAYQAVEIGLGTDIVESEMRAVAQASAEQFAGLLAKHGASAPKPQPKQENAMKAIAQKLGLNAEASEDAILAKIAEVETRAVKAEALASEKSELAKSVTAKLEQNATEITTLKAEAQANATKLAEFEVKNIVAKVEAEAKMQVGKEHGEALTRRANRYLAEADATVKADMYADMITYAKAHGVAVGKSQELPGDRPQAQTDEEKLITKATALVAEAEAKGKKLDFGKATLIAAKQMENDNA